MSVGLNATLKIPYFCLRVSVSWPVATSHNLTIPS